MIWIVFSVWLVTAVLNYFMMKRSICSEREDTPDSPNWTVEYRCMALLVAFMGPIGFLACLMMFSFTWLERNGDRRAKW